MTYRPEIDGLRAVAVVPVILYHAGYDTFSGGFVGVDVFFVISGYLITSILLRDFEAEDFSLTRFYARRARRLLPALFLVCLVSAIAAVLLLPPEPLAAFFRSLLATLGFVSNILFWSESGYFAEASELKPLLHTWSLAIEEQFYVIYPLFLMVVFPRSRRIAFILLCAAWVLSFVIATWASTAAPYANFFLIPSRAFELATGALIAFLPGLMPRTPISRSLLAGTGMLAIAVAVFTYSSATPFPGPWALLPVIGTALVIIAASQDDAVGRLLSTPLLRWVGLISYSAYLWHWPIFVF
ncbi:MAG: acyltransferase, partial [Pseudomonadota bacterium]